MTAAARANPRCQGRRKAEERQPLGILIRQRAQQDGVDDAENGCIDADAQAERENDDQREARLFQQTSRRIADVLPEHFHLVFASNEKMGMMGRRLRRE
jgi:hypothetical protein